MEGMAYCIFLKCSKDGHKRGSVGWEAEDIVVWWVEGFDAGSRARMRVKVQLRHQLHKQVMFDSIKLLL